MAKAKTLVVLDAGSADKLGVLLAQIKDLTDQADGIKDAIKLAGESIEGSLFKATLVDMDRKVFDKDFFIEKHGADLYEDYTKNTVCVSVRVTAR
jgi:hypothetical protein